MHVLVRVLSFCLCVSIMFSFLPDSGNVFAEEPLVVKIRGFRDDKMIDATKEYKYQLLELILNKQNLMKNQNISDPVWTIIRRRGRNDRHILHRKLSGMGVTKPVRMNALLDAGLLRKSRKKLPDIRSVDRSSMACAEELSAGANVQFGTDAQPPSDQVDRPQVDTNRPKSVAFAMQHADGSALEINILRQQ